jgi:hypothetical protein
LLPVSFFGLRILLQTATYFIQDEDIVWEEAQDKFKGFEIAG